MSSSRFIRLMLVVFFIAACNQVGLGVGTAVKNFFMSPVKEVSKVFTNREYRKQRDISRAAGQVQQEQEIQYCIGDNGQPIPQDKVNDLESLESSVRNLSCQCKAWGSCSKDICPCESLCPEGFGIFRRFSESTKDLSGRDNGLSFRNGSIPSQHTETNGYCWGHAKVTSQFNRLAFFKPDLQPPHDLNSQNEEEQNRAIAFYKDLIDKVNKNQATDIPGFRNLHELSSHPAFESYLADKVAKTWANEAMSWQGLGVVTNARKQSQKKYREFISQVKERVDLNMQPTIVFNPREVGVFSHAVLVSHYEERADGSIKLCIRDNNNSEENARSCRDNMWLHPEDGLKYDQRGYVKNVGNITIAHNENADAVSQSSSLRAKCRREKSCPN
jgi:hypothetical protein